MNTKTNPDLLFGLQPDTVRCPFDVLAGLREQAPVCFVDRIDAYVVSRYDDLLHVLKNPETFSSSNTSGPSGATALARRIANGESDVGDFPQRDRLVELAKRRVVIGSAPALITADPPLHNRQRKLVNRAFTPRQIALLEDSITQISDDLIDSFVHDGKVELVSQFCVGLPLIVIADALGVSRDDRPRFRTWSDAFVLALGSPGLSAQDTLDMLESINEFYDYFLAEIEDRERSPRDDLLSMVVNARIDGDTLGQQEKLQILSQLLVAGNETTTNLLASTMLRLVTDAVLMANVRSDPAMIPRVAEEVLRLETPSSGIYRVVAEDTELGGVDLPAGSHVFLSFLSANRDESRFARAEEIHLDDDSGLPHLSFGFGEHYCLGAPLARAEARIGLELLLDRLDDIALDGSPDDLEVVSSFAIRGPARLPLTFRPAHTAAQRMTTHG